MNYILISILFYMSLTTLIAQNKESELATAKIIYKFHFGEIDRLDLPEGMPNIPMDIVKRIEESEKYIATEIEGELWFNNTTSIYKIPDNLIFDKLGGFMIRAVTKAGKTFYHNRVRKEKIEQTYTDLFPGDIDIIYPYESIDWHITNERKIIGGYECIKAIGYQPEIRKNPLLAWFTPEIPVPFGPAGIDGLPGLIMEYGGTQGRANKVYAAKIELVLKDPGIDMSFKKANKELTLKEFSEISSKSMEDLRRKNDNENEIPE